MRFSVSTVKDTPENVSRFVARNLAGGLDHLVVFLDAPDDPATPEVRALLEGHEHVTCVVADDTWWQGRRPSKLNVRQRVNANLVKALLTYVEPAEWVFHIDADEVVRLDPEAMLRVPRRARSIQLAPYEAVSRKAPQADDHTWFKTLLEPPELTLLRVLGVLDRAHNGDYFHGHVEGKTGVRPTTDVWLTLHRPLDEAGTEIQSYGDPLLRVLHYESPSGEEFVRKWTALVMAGPMSAFRPAREPTAVALHALLARGLTAEQARPHLMRIFERTTEDDVDTLRSLRLLEQVDPDEPLSTPTRLPDAERDRLHSLLAAAAQRPDKGVFHPGKSEADVRRAAAAIAGEPRRRLRR